MGLKEFCPETIERDTDVHHCAAASGHDGEHVCSCGYGWTA